MLVKGVAAENVNITRIVVLLRFCMGGCVCIQSVVSTTHVYIVLTQHTQVTPTQTRYRHCS